MVKQGFRCENIRPDNEVVIFGDETDESSELDGYFIPCALGIYEFILERKEGA